MDPENLNTNAKKTDPEFLGAQLENQKETAVQNAEIEEEKRESDKKALESRNQRRVGIKTYKDYATEELGKGGGSLTNMVLKERERDREKQRHSVKSPRNILVITLSVLLSLAGIAIVAGGYLLISSTAEDISDRRTFVVAPQPLLFTDFREELYIANPTDAKLERAIEEQLALNIPIGKMKHIYFVQDADTQPKELMPSEDFFRLVSSRVPQTLIRNVDDVFMYGYYSSKLNAPFIIFNTTQYGPVYSALLEWERDMPRDLAPYFSQEIDSAATSFQDLVLFNLDTRVLLNSQGEVIFGYTFLQDRETLVFFDSRLTLQEINTRILRNPIRR